MIYSFNAYSTDTHLVQKQICSISEVLCHGRQSEKQHLKKLLRKKIMKNR